MTRRVHVDRNICVGSGWCVNVASAVFEMDSDGKAGVIAEDGVPLDVIEDAVDSCPVSAISVDEDGPSEETVDV